MGYPLELFVSREVMNRYLCAVCQDVCKHVCETECGHIFCQSCIDRLLRNGGNENAGAACPHCRSIITPQGVHRSKFLEREIGTQPIQCNICKVWNGVLSRLTNHQTLECPDVLIRCVEWQKYGCDAMIKRKDLNNHNIQFETQHLKLQLIFIQKSHKDYISNLTSKHDKEKQYLLQKYEHEKQVITNEWRRKMLDLYHLFQETRSNDINILKENIKYANIETAIGDSSGNNNNNNNDNNNSENEHDNLETSDLLDNNDLEFTPPLKRRRLEQNDEGRHSNNSNESNSTTSHGSSSTIPSPHAFIFSNTSALTTTTNNNNSSTNSSSSSNNNNNSNNINNESIGGNQKPQQDTENSSLNNKPKRRRRMHNTLDIISTTSSKRSVL